MKPLCAAVLGLVVFALAGSAKADDAEKLIGKWEVTKTTGDTPVGAIVEFKKDGKMTAIANIDGKELKLEGTYKLAKDKLTLNLVAGDMKIDEEMTVKKITDDTLELEDKDKKVDTLKKKK